MQAAAKAHVPTQAWAEKKRDAHVDYVLHNLEQAARGEGVAFCLSNALESVANNYRANSPTISTEQRDELLSAVVRAQLSAIERLPTSYPREQINTGMQALAGQIVVWAETCGQSAQRKQHTLADLAAHARLFRNDMHNLSLVEEIDRRAGARRDSQIRELMLSIVRERFNRPGRPGDE